MRIILPLIIFCFALHNVNGQIPKTETIRAAIINSLDGKIFHVVLREVNNSTANPVQFEELRKSFTNNRVVLSFENGTLEASWVGSQPFGPCTEALCINNGNFMAFSTYCDTNNGEIKAAWTGIIKRNKIQGVFSWIMQDGSSLKYFFFGDGKERIIAPSQATAF